VGNNRGMKLKIDKKKTVQSSPLPKEPTNELCCMEHNLAVAEDKLNLHVHLLLAEATLENVPWPWFFY